MRCGARGRAANVPEEKGDGGGLRSNGHVRRGRGPTAEHRGVETRTIFMILGRKAHTSTIVTNEHSNPSAFCAVQA